MFRAATPGGVVATDRAPYSTATPKRRFLLSLLSLVILLACADSSSITSLGGEESASQDTSQPSLADAELRIVSGDAQEGEVAGFLGDPLVVEVVDVNGDPFAGAPVEWSFYQGAGKVGTGQTTKTVSTVTGTDGTASVRWQLGPRSGAQSASAEIGSAPAPVAGAGTDGLAPGNGNGRKVGFEAKATPGDIESISVSPGAATVAVGDSLQLTATALDQYGNPVEGLAYQWRGSDEGITQVSDYGMTYAMALGSSQVVAKYKSLEGSASLTNSDPSEPLPPTASIVEPTQDVTIMLGDTVHLEGDATDADGAVASHRWTFGDGYGASVEDPGPHIYSTEGTFDVTYEVTDDQGLVSGTDTSTVTVTSELNAPPIASIDAPSADTTVTLGDAVSFQGTSTDEDGSVVAHAWAFGDGGSASVEDPGSYTYAAEGSYTVTYQSTDDDGATSSLRSVVVNVSATVNQAPSATIDSPAQNLTISLGDAVDFRGSASDADGSIVSHNWTFGDGAGSSVEDPGSYTYGSAGTYTVTYEVTDDAGASASVGRTVTVSSTSSGSPTFLFHSDWSTATGTSRSAILDTDKPIPWSADKLPATDTVTFQVVSSAGLGFPTGLDAVTQVRNCVNKCGGSNDSPRTGVRLSGSGPLPVHNVGTSRFYRWYWKSTTPDDYVRSGGDNFNHPIQDGTGGAAVGLTNWEFESTMNGDGTWYPGWYLTSDGSGAQVSRFVLNTPGRDTDPPSGDILLYKDSVYMFELQVMRPHADSIQLHSKVWIVRDGLEVLLYDDDDWQLLQRGNHTTLADSVTLGAIGDDESKWRGFQWGSNGWSDMAYDSVYTAWYKGGLAICANDWCGPYTDGK